MYVAHCVTSLEIVIVTCQMPWQSWTQLGFPILSVVYSVLEMYTGCPRRNVPDFERVFLMLKYTDLTQNTYVQS